MLEDYARQNDYSQFKHFNDDGVPGARFHG